MNKAKLQTLMKSDWVELLYDYFQTESFKLLTQRIINDRKISEVYPEKENIFRVFNETALADVKVVFIGAEPYSNCYYDDRCAAIGRAYALELSGEINVHQKLKDLILKLESDLGNTIGFDNTLQHWVEQGVFLLNTALTVGKNSPGSHIGNWRQFTIAVIEALNTKNDIVFVLSTEIKDLFKEYFTNKTHKFVDINQGKPFSQCNIHLTQSIEWRMDKSHKILYDIMINNLEKLINKPRFLPLDKIEIIPPKIEEDE